MPLLGPDALLRGLAEGRRGGTFFLFGDDEVSKEEAVAAVVAAHLDPATRDFNLDQLRGADLDPETLASRIQTPPMMAEWRVVVVRDAQALAASPRTRSIIEAALERPVPGLALVLAAQVPPQSKAQFYERLKRDATAVDFAPVPESDLPGWLMARAEASGVALEPDAARALAVIVGAEPGRLVRELDKLRDYVGDRASIVVADVEAVVGRVPRQNRWAWFDLVGTGRFAEARTALPVLLDAGESGVGLVIGLGTHFLRLALAATGGERALKEALPPNQRWLAGRIARQARRWSADSLDDALDALLRADRLLKSSSIGELQILEEVLLRLQARAATAAA